MDNLETGLNVGVLKEGKSDGLWRSHTRMYFDKCRKQLTRRDYSSSFLFEILAFPNVARFAVISVAAAQFQVQKWDSAAFVLQWKCCSSRNVECQKEYFYKTYGGVLKREKRSTRLQDEQYFIRTKLKRHRNFLLANKLRLSSRHVSCVNLWL